MSTNRRAYNHKRNPFRMAPGWSTYYQIGKIAAPRMPAFCSYEQLAVRLGVSKQVAYHEALVALGKLLYLIVQATGELPEL